ncbi:MAG: prepilin-type N-terminal cleavage/methylation domain-containing protein [Candidatus Moranbacteria bacterium]|nr:prepilin-type N-terminal cleavage/methylation domain-containing protein [Candidatus Moranbacteria bacterium]MDD3965392.1 prepilin-type N-terminal cleavage/methylation domain-containing protein [Candidatus Moranbacteria bacterium]
MQNAGAHTQRWSGFTLIEVIVTIAIVSILTSVAISGINSGAKTQRELETNAREFASVVREAQNYALTGKQANVAGTNTCSFLVSQISSTQYTLSAIACGTGTAELITTYTLKNGVGLSGTSSITFVLPRGVPSSVGAVIFSKGDNRYYVCVSADGKIEDKSSCP